VKTLQKTFSMCYVFVVPVYRLYRMKDSPRQNFRWAPHTIGPAQAKQKDYDLAGEHNAPSAYSLWQSLKPTEASLQVGDIIELPDGSLRIFKYVGFEEVEWLAAEPQLSPGGPRGHESAPGSAL
jgi:hypothetical protein